MTCFGFDLQELIAQAIAWLTAWGAFFANGGTLA